MKTTFPPLETSTRLFSPAFRRLGWSVLLVGMLWGGAADAEEKRVAEYPWKTLPAQAKSDPALFQEDAGHGAVAVTENPASQPLRKTLLTIEKPPITADFYRLAGEVRYENVEGDSYLEMWSAFPPATPGGSERSYFSRTLAESSQMGKLRGTSDWREFSLPFNATGSGAHPVRLTFNVVLVGKGKVVVGETKLWEGSMGTAGWWGGWVPGWYAGSGAGRWIFAIVGLCGAGGVTLAAIRLRRRHRQDEARRMAARDILA